MVPKYYATSRYQNLLLFKFNSQFHTVGIPLLPSMNQKPHHKGNQQGWVAFGNIYPLTSPKWEYPQATFKHHICAPLQNLNFNPQNYQIPLQSKGGVINRHYMTKEVISYKLREREVGNQKSKEWRRKWWHRSPHSSKTIGEASPMMGGWLHP